MKKFLLSSMFAFGVVSASDLPAVETTDVVVAETAEVVADTAVVAPVAQKVKKIIIVDGVEVEVEVDADEVAVTATEAAVTATEAAVVVADEAADVSVAN